MTDAEIADIYAGDYKGDVSSDLINRIVTLKDRQTKDRKTINRIKQKHGGNDNTINNPNVTSNVGIRKKILSEKVIEVKLLQRELRLIKLVLVGRKPEGFSG